MERSEAMPATNSPEAPAEMPTPVTNVYNLTVLVQRFPDGGTSARAANLPLGPVKSPSVRDALSELVKSAKQLIHEKRVREDDIPWVDPPNEAAEHESRFMVPLHL